MRDGQVYLVSGDGDTAFKNVLFVVDDLERPLLGLIQNALYHAAANDLRSVSIPTIRTGVMADAYESKEEAIDALIGAIRMCWEVTGDMVINVIVYDDPDAFATLTKAFPQS
jgi:O-acetyl-ADP-ribose deacetylase (regulator of RNase III)